jgi:predicted DNA-binding transcriptional regulator YafY
VTDVEITDDRFERAPDFKLEAHWRDVCDRFESRLPEYLVHLRVRGPAAGRLRWSARVLELGEPDDAGWCDAKIDTESEAEAATIVLSLAPDVIVTSPATLVASTHEAALAFVARQPGAIPRGP